MVVSVVNQKGGSGKSTIACHLAAMNAVEGKKTMLFDLDSQGSSIGFRDQRPEDRPQFAANTLLKPTLYRDITAYENFDEIIVDAGGRDSVLFRSAILPADLIVIPVEPGIFDFWALEDTLQVVDEIRAQTGKEYRAIIVYNKVTAGSNISIAAKNKIEEIAQKHNVMIAKSQLCHRVGYGEAILKGLSVTECNGNNYNSPKVEMKSLFAEIYEKE